MKPELFICGDPRFLAGGHRINSDAERTGTYAYESTPPYLKDGDTVDTSETVLENMQNIVICDNTSESIPDVVYTTMKTCATTAIYEGRTEYHGHAGRVARNVFTKKEDFPTIGVEIEVLAKDDNSAEIMRTPILASNWFWMEVDGSLGNRNTGHEIITQILPPRAYRDINLWSGLQNLLAPYAESYKHDTTGLHIHVGLQDFVNIEFPFIKKCKSTTPVKYLLLYIYYKLLDRAFVDQVFMRGHTEYCTTGLPPCISVINPNESLTALELCATIATVARRSSTFFLGRVPPISKLETASFTNLANACSNVLANLRGLSDNDQTGLMGFGSYAGHHQELNFDHKYTVEFRRGKGITNAVEVHRMVELASLIVRYAKKIMEKPDMVVSRNNIYQFIYDNTTSEALRKTVLKYSTVKGN